MELIRHFSPSDLTSALDDWFWIGLEGLTPRFATAFGDLVLTGRGGEWFLDTIGGRLFQIAADEAAVDALLATDQAQLDLLHADLVEAGLNAGLVPSASQVYSFTHPPMLGGQLSGDNLEVGDFQVVMSLGGQIHRQLKDLPDGTPITIQLAGQNSAEPAPTPVARPKKKWFWQR